ncbi:unnamed protein product [Echinostoma caproni]|uniref:Uncharacterized protein n=1 Tax=Echinostoma caproni TaxID=27848 RepID=A0A183B2U6_9TREM|nr:unnamed protein product [Echinostoma caproni]
MLRYDQASQTVPLRKLYSLPSRKAEVPSHQFEKKKGRNPGPLLSSRIGRQPNAVKFHCAIEIRQLRSLRGSYACTLDTSGGHPGTPGPATSTGLNAYTPFGVDVGGQAMDSTTNPGSTHNRSDVESPKYSPDTLTPTYASKRDSNVWSNEHKPPLSLLLFLPRVADPIDVTSSCSTLGDNGTITVSGDSGVHGTIGQSGTYMSSELSKSSQFSPSGGYNPIVSGSVCDRLNVDRQSSSLSLGTDSICCYSGNHQSNRENHLAKTEDEDFSIRLGAGGGGGGVLVVACLS